MQKREIDKIEAARIQIQVADRIFFEKKDCIAVLYCSPLRTKYS